MDTASEGQPKDFVFQSPELKRQKEQEDAQRTVGENFTENKNLFVTDSRNNIIYEYRIPQLAPTTEEEIAIQGDFQVIINTVTLTDQNTPSETYHYTIYIVDRAGNISNTIETSDITVNQP